MIMCVCVWQKTKHANKLSAELAIDDISQELFFFKLM